VLYQHENTATIHNMNRKLILLVIILMGYFGVFFFYDQLSLYVGSYRVSSASSNIALDNVYQPGQFITASMYDDAVVYVDGTEQTILTTVPTINSWDVSSDILGDLWYFLFTSVRTPSHVSKKIHSYYTAHVTSGEITISRNVKNDSKQIVGLRRTLIVPFSSKILINNYIEVRDFPLVESKRFIADGVNEITISMSSSPYIIKLPVKKDQSVAFFSSDAGIVIASTIYFEQKDRSIFGWFADEQTLQLHPYEY